MYLLIVSILLLIAAYFDWKTLKIPNWWHLLAIITAFGLNITGFNDQSMGKMILNALIIFIPLFLLWLFSTLAHFKAIGAGDIKLFGVLALFIPLLDSYLLFLITLVISSLIAVVKLRSGRFKEMFNDLSFFVFYGIPGKSNGKMEKVPMAPFLFLSFMFYLTPYYEFFSSYWR